MNEPCAKITLDVQQSSTATFVAVKRGDIGRKIVISLSDGGFPYEIAADCYAVLTGTKPDGNILYNHCDIEGNTIVYEITEQTSAVAGRIPCEIKLYGADDALITSTTFRIIVDGTIYGDDRVESATEISALTHLVSEASTVIQTGNETIARGQETIEETQKAILETEAARNAANQATIEAGTAKERADTAATSANSAANNANMEATNAKKAAASAIQVATDTEAFLQDAMKQTQEWMETSKNEKNAILDQVLEDTTACIEATENAKNDMLTYTGNAASAANAAANAAQEEASRASAAANSANKLVDDVQQKLDDGDFNGTSVTHEWEGTTLHVTSARGTSSADLKGETGNVYISQFYFGEDGHLYLEYPEQYAGPTFEINNGCLEVIFNG